MTALRPYAVVTLRLLLGISICDANGNLSPRNFAQVGAISIVLSIIYTVAIQYLLNRYAPSQQPEPAAKACCSCK